MKRTHEIAAGRRQTRKLLSCALASCLMLGAAPAFAQSTAATIRGQVLVDSTPATEAKVTATNLATGLSRTVQASGNGNYTLAGLPPGNYRIDVAAGGKASSQTVTVQVGQTATLNLGVGGVAETAAPGATTTLDAVNVVAPALVETRTSEISTYVTSKQIEALPQGARNFLAFADIVPGMQFATDTDGSTSIRSGAQSANNINVYIDGVGQKNYVLQGGISGQDSSRGNPFPQSAIGEYKVITSNYKAEYDQLSSAAITAVTRSGTNDFKGSFFWDHTADNWRAPTVFEKKSGDGKIPSKEEQYGVSFGGPIVQDQAHFFVAYEAKEYDSPRTVIPGQGYTIAQLPANLQDLTGSVSAPFKEDLYFAKLDWSIGDNHLLELTAKYRDETELTAVGDGPNTVSYGTDKDNDETRVDLRYQYTYGDWLNDAHLTYEDANYNPRPHTLGPGYSITGQNWYDAVLNYGGGGDYQNKGQTGYSLQDDLTFTGWEGHTLKMGVKVKHVDVKAQEQQPYNPQYYYDVANLATPYKIRFGYGLAGIGDGSAKSSNKQYGIYLQDDWEVTSKLTLNLGVRWDYEESPAYLDYVTPADVLASINAQDPNAPAGQTYAQTLALGGVDINRYISNGRNRSSFKNAWQPRLGFSYDLFEDERHVIFGGAGRSYDRNLFDWMQLEMTKATFPVYEYDVNTALRPCSGPKCLTWSTALLDPNTLYSLVTGGAGSGREVDMLVNDIKVPYSDQFSLGMRNAVDLWGQEWNTSVTLQRIESHDGFAFLLGNRRPDGSFFPPGGISDSPWGFSPPGLGPLILGVNGVETRANSVLLSIDKPYTRQSGWSTSIAYTYTDAKENRQFGEHYSLDYPTMAGYGWLSAGGVPEHRLVVTGIVDGPWGFTFSSKLSLASQTPRYVRNCVVAWDQCFNEQYKPDGTFGFKQFDLAAEKVWDTGSNLKLRIRGDLLNVFNWTNYARYDDWAGDGGNANPNFKSPTAVYLPTRTFKLTFGLDW